MDLVRYLPAILLIRHIAQSVICHTYIHVVWLLLSGMATAQPADPPVIRTSVARSTRTAHGWDKVSHTLFT